jgi:hypothetical protein
MGVVGSFADGDPVLDGDLPRADEDVFDEQPQDALAFSYAGATGVGSQLVRAENLVHVMRPGDIR